MERKPEWLKVRYNQEALLRGRAALRFSELRLRKKAIFRKKEKCSQFLTLNPGEYTVY